MSASIVQIWNIVTSRSKFVFTPSFIFCSLICSNNGDVVFFVKIYFSFRELTFFYSTAQIRKFSPWISLELCDDSTWPPTFLSTHAFVLSSKLNPLLLLKLANKYLLFGEYFCKVTVKVSLCICVVLSWDKVKVRQNSLHTYIHTYFIYSRSRW